jgi:hypothetical protein
MNMKDAIAAVAVFLLFTLAIGECRADDVKYCKDARTGKVIVVPAGTPCPYPTHEL